MTDGSDGQVDRSPGVSRRHFLALGVAFAVPLVPQFVATAQRYLPGADPAELAARHLAGLLAHPESAAVIGWAWLAMSPERADPAGLAGSVARALALQAADPTDAVLAMDPAALLEAVRGSISADFARGATVRLDGWVLARTEVELAALTALAAPGLAARAES